MCGRSWPRASARPRWPPSQAVETAPRVILGDSELTFDGDTRRIYSSTLTDLNSPHQPGHRCRYNHRPCAPDRGLQRERHGRSRRESCVFLGLWRRPHLDRTKPAHTYTEDGIYMVMLEVRRRRGRLRPHNPSRFLGDREPTARISVSESIVSPGVEITLDGSGSTDPEGDPPDLRMEPRRRAHAHRPCRHGQLATEKSSRSNSV